jgi:hypothetical protein
MKLKSHGRYDYSAITERKDYSWPGGKRLAVHFCLNVEHFSFGEGLGNDYAAPHPQPTQSPPVVRRWPRSRRSPVSRHHHARREASPPRRSRPLPPCP